MQDFSHIDKHISEEEMFEGYEQSPYLQALYGLINQFRYQRQPYCELRVLTEGDVESDSILKSMLIVDNVNPAYNMDFTKFLATITGGGGAGTIGGPGSNVAAGYY